MNHTLKDYQARIQRVLDTALDDAKVPQSLGDAMRYSTLAGGKRFRALLVYATGDTLGISLERLDCVAVAVECIHAYSLIHDDLPAMDDDDLRRGQPTTHIKFDEATAILAGDALHALAFEMVNSPDSNLNDNQCREISYRLAQAIGPVGMVGGQILDLLATGQTLERNALEDIHRRKTGALISASVLCSAICAEQIDLETLQSLEDYSNHIGLAFQVVDDILDIESSTEMLGKTSGADQAIGKSTYPALLGLAESKELAQNLYQQAIESVRPIGDNTALLMELAELVVSRKH